LQDEATLSDPSVEHDALSVHDSFDDRTFLMALDVVTPQPQRTKNSAWKEKFAREKPCKGTDTADNCSTELIVENKNPKPKEALEPTIEKYLESVESRDTIEAARRESSPNKNLVINLKVQRQAAPPVHDPPSKVVGELEILSEDSKDAMYASVTNRKKTDPGNVAHHHTGPVTIISSIDIIQKIPSQDMDRSPEKKIENSESNTTFEKKHSIEPKSASLQEREPSRKLRSGRPSAGNKSKSKSKKPVKKVRDADLSAKDQATLAQNVRDICLRATPELDGEDYPSFDEPEPKDLPGSKTRPGRDSPASEMSGGENKQIVANEEKKKKSRSKKEKSKRSSSVKPSTRKAVRAAKTVVS
jgi:hypothetical protein